MVVMVFSFFLVYIDLDGLYGEEKMIILVCLVIVVVICLVVIL